MQRAAATAEIATAAAEGRINGYLCGVCGRYTVTIDRHEGVTPSTLTCRAGGVGDDQCLGRAYSMFYVPPSEWPAGAGRAPRPTPTWEWYMPVGKEAERIRRNDPETWDHVRRGGLLLRPFSPSDQRPFTRPAQEETAP
jgi:hypothetical protein